MDLADTKLTAFAASSSVSRNPPDLQVALPILTGCGEHLSMKTSLFLLAGACALASYSPAQAQTQTRPGFEVGAQLFDYNYRERLDGSTIVRDDGKFIGLTASYVETIGSGWFLRAATDTGSGSVDYSSDDGRIDDVSQYLAQVEFHLGRDFLVGDVTAITPFTGIGGRALNDNSGGEETESGARGYDREIGYAYIPVGLAATFPFGSRWSLALSGQYNHIVRGTAESKLSRLDPEAPDVSLDLDGGYGIETSAMFSAPIGRKALRFGPFVRHWNLQRSKSQVFREDGFEIGFFEPANRTTELGLRLAFAF